MRRGFKTEAEEVAADVREELGIGLFAPLDPWLLAELLGVEVWALTTFHGAAQGCVDTLTGQAHGAFHAMIAFLGERQVIVHNDRNALVRQHSDIAHELAHALLVHEPHLAVAGQRFSYDKEQEKEAAWLSGALLAPRAACLHACRNDMSVEATADWLHISTAMARYRIDASGARAHDERSRRKAGRR